MDDSLSPASAPGRSPLSPEAITATVRSVVERQVATTRAGKALTAIDAALVANLVQNIVGNVSMVVAGMVDEAREVAAQSANTWSWRDRTEDMAALGFPASQTRYVEVYADGCSLVCIDETGISHWSGVEIDWLDVVLADVNGKRKHERVGADGERKEAA